MKSALVLGGAGFIGHHMVRRLKKDGFWVRSVDLKYPEFGPSEADEFIRGDLRSQATCLEVINRRFDEIYQFAADMGGAGYIFTGENDADIMHNSALININVLKACEVSDSKNIFYSSSACVYPRHNQADPDNPNCEESSAYPADPDSQYGWEKLFSERLYLSYAKNKGFRVRIGRYHNIYGEEGTWRGGKEKAPAAICRKIAELGDEGEVEIWGDGLQTRSFLYIDDCIKGTLKVMRSEFQGPFNIGSEKNISINELVLMVASIARKRVTIKNVQGPEGVRGRNSDNKLISLKVGWAPECELEQGLETTYAWVEKQLVGAKA